MKTNYKCFNCNAMASRLFHCSACIGGGAFPYCLDHEELAIKVLLSFHNARDLKIVLIAPTPEGAEEYRRQFKDKIFISLTNVDGAHNIRPMARMS